MQNHSKLIIAALAGVVVLAAFGVPVLAFLPVLAIFAVCALMMTFMMRGMDHGGSRDRDGVDSPQSGHRH